MKKLSVVLLSLLVVFICTSCASVQHVRSVRYLASAEESAKKGQFYAALTAAVNSYTEEANEKAAEFIKRYADAGLAEGFGSLSSFGIARDKLDSFLRAAKELQDLQDKIVRHRFLASNSVDVAPVVAGYKTRLGVILREEMTECAEKHDNGGFIDRATVYMSMKLPATDPVVSALANKVALECAAAGDAQKAAALVRVAEGVITRATRADAAEKLSGAALRHELEGQKRKAMDTYILAAGIDGENSFAREKAARLKRELETVFFVLDVENATDKILKADNAAFAKTIKGKIDDKDRLFEVVLQDRGLANLKKASVDYPSCYDFLRKSKNVSVEWENNIRVLIATKVISLKSAWGEGRPVKRAMEWDEKSLAALWREQDAYGSDAKIQHYEYTEFGESLQISLIAIVLLYDCKSGEFLCEERIELEASDETVWAEKPVAVGEKRRFAATVMPPELAALLKNPHSVDENALKAHLVQKLAGETAKKVLANLAP